jgi:hypothetical protein
MMNNDPYQIRPLSFYLWWTACAALVWPLSVIALAVILMPLGIIFNVVRPLPYDNPTLETLWLPVLAVLGGVIIAAVIANLQYWLLRTKVYWAADRWRFWTMLGGLFGGVALLGGRLLLELLTSYSIADRWMPLLAMPIFMLFISLGQWMALRHAVRDAWLWVLGNAVAGMVFGGLLSNNPSGDTGVLLFGLAVLSQALITGTVLLYLFEKRMLPMQPAASEVPESGDDSTPKSIWDQAI